MPENDERPKKPWLFQKGNKAAVGHGAPRGLNAFIDAEYARRNTTVLGELIAIAMGERPGFGPKLRLRAMELSAAYQHGKPVDRSVVLASTNLDSITAAQVLNIDPKSLVALARVAGAGALPAQTTDVIDVVPDVTSNNVKLDTPPAALPPDHDKP